MYNLTIIEMTSTMNFRRLFAGAAATLTLMEKRAATALLIMLLTTATAWADNVTYIVSVSVFTHCKVSL
jgi:hypothetical protein